MTPLANTNQLIIPPRTKDLGGFSVQRILPFAQKRKVGPWIFFDHMGPADFPPGEGIDVRPHPHINLATVTYLFEGTITHRDSLGTCMDITPGAINLMVAGKGIVHSERTNDTLRASGQRMEGLQLWLALPEEHEEIEPAFYHYLATDIPSTHVNDVPVRVLIGNAFGLTSPVKTFADTLYVEIRIQENQTIELPKAQETALYVVEGEILIHDHIIPKHHMVILDSSNQYMNASKDSLIVIIGGQKLSERHLFWNFVSSRKERIEQAKDDWKHMRFDLIEGDDTEFIPLP